MNLAQRIGAEFNTLRDTELTPEVNARIDADATLTINLSSEATTARAAEATLTLGLSNEVTRATAAELVLTTDLAAETTRATGAEATLTSDLAAEASAARLAESTLTSNLAGEVTTARAAELALSNDLAAEVTAARAAELTLSNNLSSEITRSTAIDNTLTSDLASETTRATGAESGIQSELDATQVGGGLDADGGYTADALTNYTSSATSLKDADKKIDAQVKVNTDGISSEASARISADNTLQANIDAEETARTNADATLTTNLNTEKGRIDAILAASTADANTFAEIVTLVNSVDTTNDTAFASYVLSNDAAVGANTTKLAGIEAGAKGDQTAAEILALIKTVDGAGSGLNADLLDGLSSGSFVRTNSAQSLRATDAIQVSNDTITIFKGDGTSEAVSISDANTWRGIENVLTSTSTSNSLTAAQGKVLKGLVDTINTKLNGIESGATADQTAAEILAAIKTVDGAGSGLDADLLDGASQSTNSTANTIVKRDASGDINSRLFRSEYDVTNATIGYIMTQVDTVSNNYMRPSTPAQLATAMGLGTVNKIIGTDTDVNTAGATIIDNMYMTDGVITSHGTRVLTLADLGYTGETNATADQTAAQMLAAIKTVDGSGSGLDADLLDGQSSAFYAQTTALATEKGRIDAILTSSSADLNTFAEVVALVNAVDTTNDTAFASYVLSNNTAVGANTSKLAGIEAGATADQTAAEILAAIKTVDGSGSGLDADLLDGKSSASFNQVIGTDTDINTSGATIVDNIYVTDGVITSMGTRTLTAGDLGVDLSSKANTAGNNTQTFKVADAVASDDAVSKGQMDTIVSTNVPAGALFTDTVPATFVANDSRVKTALNASGTAPIYACRAWVNFNGTAVTATADLTGVRASGNVSSVVDLGVGYYQVNLITPVEDANYSIAFAHGGVVPNTERNTILTGRALTSSSFYMSCHNFISSVDTSFLQTSIHR